MKNRKAIIKVIALRVIERPSSDMQKVLDEATQWAADMNIDFLNFTDATAKSQFLKNITEDAQTTMNDEEVVKKLKKE